MQIDPAQIDLTERYKLLIGAIVPRPIAWVSTRSEAGADNLAPFSFFSAISADPCSLLFCPSNKPDGSEKDTLINASSSMSASQSLFIPSQTSGPSGTQVESTQPSSGTQ